MPNLSTRIKNAWNAFVGSSNRDPTTVVSPPSYEPAPYGTSYSMRPDRIAVSRGNEKSIMVSIQNRIALDVASISIRHVYNDANGRYMTDANSRLNDCLTTSANIDQTPRALVQDIVMTMFNDGCAAIVPYDTDVNPLTNESYDIFSLRVGSIIEWYPDAVKVRMYNDYRGTKEEVVLPKRVVGIVENPFFAIMNEPNSTLKRLTRKLNYLDAIDKQASAGKLDIIIQLPFALKSELKRQEAERRRQEIADQLKDSQYGIAYADATERITQLNRPLENNLMKQIEYLMGLLFSQLGITQAVFDGTADEAAMLNYNNRTIEPILSAITDEMKRKFLTKTARTQGQSIVFFRDPFRLVPVNQIADIADKFTRNEIMTSNEIRQIVGMKPSDDPSADELRNKNLNQSFDEQQMMNEAGNPYYGESDTPNADSIISRHARDPI